MVVGLVLASACGMEKEQAAKEEREQHISAARLNGKFDRRDPVVAWLSDDERSALERAGMMDPKPEAELASAGEGGEGDDADDPDDPDDPLGGHKTKEEKAEDMMMSVLTVGITVGMMVAPYLLF